MATQYQLPPRRNTAGGAQPDGTTLALRGRNDPLAFLEFTSCQICGCEFNEVIEGGRARRFYMASCGHIFCNDKTHQHRAGTCTFCNRQNIRVFELDESLPPQLLLWYQPTEEIMRVMEGNMTMMKFQQEQLTRLARSQRQKLNEDKRLLEEATMGLRAAKDEITKQKRALEDLTRQCREMRAQRDAAVKQSEDLQSELAMAKTNANRRLMPGRGYNSVNGSYPADVAPMDPPMMERPQHRDELPFDVTGSRKRPFDVVQDEEMDTYKTPRAQHEFRNRPGTAGPQFYTGGGDSVRSPSAMGFAPRGNVARAQSAIGFASVKNNLDQFRYREEAVAGGPMPLPQGLRPSFSLADPSRKRLRPSSTVQHRYMSQSRNAFSAPNRYENMGTINETGDDVDVFQP